MPAMTTKLTAALAKRAEAAAAKKKQRIVEQALADIELIRRRRSQITEAFYDIGEALVRLKKPDVVRALGFGSFKQLCESRLDMSVATANRLAEIPVNLSRAQALKLGQSKANALIGLSEATPEADSATTLSRKRKLRLPGGESLDVTAASGRQVEQAATAIRRAKSRGGEAAGKTVTAEEAEAASVLQASLRKLGVVRAKVVAVATRPGAAAEIRIAGLTAAQLPLLRKAAPTR